MQEKKEFSFKKRKKIVVTFNPEVVEQVRALAVENGLYRKNPVTGEVKGNLSRAIECLAVEALEARALAKKRHDEEIEAQFFGDSDDAFF